MTCINCVNRLEEPDGSRAYCSKTHWRIFDKENGLTDKYIEVGDSDTCNEFEEIPPLIRSMRLFDLDCSKINEDD